LGAVVINADELVRDAGEPGRVAVQALGPEVLGPPQQSLPHSGQRVIDSGFVDAGVKQRIDHVLASRHRSDSLIRQGINRLSRTLARSLQWDGGRTILLAPGSRCPPAAR